MDLSQIVTILLSLTTLSLGTFFGILRNKLLKLDDNNKFHYFFYTIPIVIFILIIYTVYKFSEKVLDTFPLVIIIISSISCVLLYWITRKYLVTKNIYKSKELDPVVNNFTDNADKRIIKLFGGDLDFLGRTLGDMDKHPQYIKLKEMEFRKIEILCAEPTSNIQKMRYGKIIHDLPQTNFRFYEPEKADLFVRGRIKVIQGVEKLLIYTKINKGIYKAIETDTSDSNGALYGNIWNLVWSLAAIPTDEMIKEYKLLYEK